MTLDFFERFREHQERLPDHTGLQIITAGGREAFNYRRIGEELAKISLFLQRSGVRPGDAVGLLMENHPRWCIAFLAAQSAGAVVVPLDTLHPPETIAELIQSADCKFLISSERFCDKLEAIRSHLPGPLPLLLAGAGWDAALAETEASAPVPLVSRGPDEDFVILFTGGTTGKPKGVVLSRRNIFRNVVELLAIIRATPQDHLLSVLPLYHALALIMNFLIPLYLGARVTYLDVVDPQRVLSVFRELGITIFVCVPQFYYLIHSRIFQEIEKQHALKRFLFGRLLAFSRFSNRRLGWNPGRLLFPAIHEKFGRQFRFFGVGGARFAPQVAESLRDLGFDIVQAYGMTETGGLATLATARPDMVGSTGRPLPHIEIRIDEPDEAGVGEVLIRGENIMKGYWRDPEATAAVIHGGWLHSGDLGRLAPGGLLYITGRKKDVIVLSSGKNIFPEEIEQFYQTNCPHIKEMCILGVPDPTSRESREKLHAVIVPDFDYLRQKQIVNTYDMIRYYIENISQRLPPHKRIRSFEVRTEALPRTTTRKLQRFRIEKEVQSGAAAKPRFAEDTPPGSVAEEEIFRRIRRIKKAPVIRREMNLEIDLEFDSLERVELLSDVQEALGVEIPDEAAGGIFTVQELVAAVESRLPGGTLGPREASVSWSDILREPLDRDEQRRLEETLRRRPVTEWVAYGIVRLAYVLGCLLLPLRVRGRETLQLDPPFLICSNHGSYLDVFLLAGTLPRRVLQRLFFLGYTDLFSGAVLSFLARRLRIIPIDPDRQLRKSLRLGLAGLQKGLILCAFPEGERTIDGTLKPFRKGPAILAVEMQAPVVPVSIIGAYEAWPRHESFPRRHPVEIRFGEPLRPPEGQKAYDAFNGRIFRAVRDLR